jgi:gamma-butyrobetaine dioxygenase
MVIRPHLAADGYVVLRDAAPSLDDAWAYVTELVGERPEMIERQHIRPHAKGTSYASTAIATPLHTDSQDYLGAPPKLQIMACVRAAARGGESLLVDGRALLERCDPALRDALLHEPRRQRFYFGDIVGPTVALKRGHHVWTLSPIPHHDPIGEALARELARAPVIELALRAGDVLVVDNHRMLHGRTAFEGEREFVRVLAWLAAQPTDAARRLAAVLELVTGGAPPRIAREAGVSDGELYRWRTRALAAALAALDEL